MQTNERLRLTLDLDPGADPIAGRVEPQKGPGEPFAGYVELIAALERARNGGAEASSADVAGGRPAHVQEGG